MAEGDLMVVVVFMEVAEGASTRAEEGVFIQVGEASMEGVPALELRRPRPRALAIPAGRLVRNCAPGAPRLSGQVTVFPTPVLPPMRTTKGSRLAAHPEAAHLQ